MELPITDKDLISRCREYASATHLHIRPRCFCLEMHLISPGRCRNEYDTASTAGSNTSAEGLRLVWVRLVERALQLPDMLHVHSQHLSDA
jgi:hypothetical protein